MSNMKNKQVLIFLYKQRNSEFYVEAMNGKGRRSKTTIARNLIFAMDGTQCL